MDWFWVVVLSGYGAMIVCTTVIMAREMYKEIKNGDIVESAVYYAPLISLFLGVFWPVVILYGTLNWLLSRGREKEKVEQ